MKNIFLRVVALLLVIFAVIFSYTYNGFTLGDYLLAKITLPSWSNNNQSGTHYTVGYSLLLIFLSIFLCSLTIKNNRGIFILISILILLTTVVLMVLLF